MIRAFTLTEPANFPSVGARHGSTASVFATFALLGALSACSPNRGLDYDQDPNTISGRHSKLGHTVVASDSLREEVVVTKKQDRVEPTNVISVSIDLQNVSSRTISLEYRFLWYDTYGVALHKRSPTGSARDVDVPWQSLRLGAGDRTTVSQTATTRRATDYRLEMREAGGGS